MQNKFPNMKIVKDIKQMFDMEHLFADTNPAEDFRVCPVAGMRADFNALARRMASYMPYADNNTPLENRVGQYHIEGESLLMTPKLWWDRLRPWTMSGPEKTAFDILRKHIKTAESLMDAFCMVSLVYSHSPTDEPAERDIFPTVLDSSFVCCYNHDIILQKEGSDDSLHLNAGNAILHLGDYDTAGISVNVPKKEPDGTPLILLSALLG